jgi:soluble lytic murein transglycosylase
LRAYYPVKYREPIERLSLKYGVDPRLTQAVIHAESKYRPRAKSPAGAVGLMQLMPSTAAQAAASAGLVYDPARLTEPEYNIELGVCYLCYLTSKFDLWDAVAAYNAGESNVRRWLAAGVPYLFPETAAYVRRVRRALNVYKFYG